MSPDDSKRGPDDPDQPAIVFTAQGVAREEDLVEQFRRGLQIEAIKKAVSRDSQCVDAADYQSAYDDWRGRSQDKGPMWPQALGSFVVFLAAGLLGHGLPKFEQSDWAVVVEISAAGILGLTGIIILYMLRSR